MFADAKFGTGQLTHTEPAIEKIWRTLDHNYISAFLVTKCNVPLPDERHRWSFLTVHRS